LTDSSFSASSGAKLRGLGNRQPATAACRARRTPPSAGSCTSCTGSAWTSRPA